uniref:Uncharacterized protein n=1 Tax=Rhizophora mucronata TaxID=61149 RepID=A0A2P2PE81_RHIMU
MWLTVDPERQWFQVLPFCPRVYPLWHFFFSLVGLII